MFKPFKIQKDVGSLNLDIDPKFSDSLDGFLILDIHTIPNEILKKLGKNIQD